MEEEKPQESGSEFESGEFDGNAAPDSAIPSQSTGDQEQATGDQEQATGEHVHVAAEQPADIPQAEPVQEEAVAAEEPVEAASSNGSEPSSDDSQATSVPPAVEAANVVETADVVETAPPKPKLYDRMHWYVVHAYSGFELKAKKALEERVRSRDLEEYFGEIHVPQETVVELVRGQKKTSNRKFFPGYLLVQMVLNEDTWHLVKETPKISGFLGDATDPAPLSEEEVNRILSQVEEGSAAPRSRAKFEQGETVKVIDGPFTDFNGTVEEVKPEKGKVKVLISIFGRATPVELDFIQVEKC